MEGGERPLATRYSKHFSPAVAMLAVFAGSMDCPLCAKYAEITDMKRKESNKE